MNSVDHSKNDYGSNTTKDHTTTTDIINDNQCSGNAFEGGCNADDSLQHSNDSVMRSNGTYSATGYSCESQNSTICNSNPNVASDLDSVVGGVLQSCNETIAIGGERNNTVSNCHSRENFSRVDPTEIERNPNENVAKENYKHTNMIPKHKYKTCNINEDKMESSGNKTIGEVDSCLRKGECCTNKDVYGTLLQNCTLSSEGSLIPSEGSDVIMLDHGNVNGVCRILREFGVSYTDDLFNRTECYRNEVSNPNFNPMCKMDRVTTERNIPTTGNLMKDLHSDINEEKEIQECEKSIEIEQKKRNPPTKDVHMYASRQIGTSKDPETLDLTDPSTFNRCFVALAGNELQKSLPTGESSSSQKRNYYGFDSTDERCCEEKKSEGKELDIGISDRSAGLDIWADKELLKHNIKRRHGISNPELISKID